MTDVAFIDLETTGLDPETADITEIAVVRLRHKPNSLEFFDEPVDIFETKVQPFRAWKETDGKICPFIAKINKYDRDVWKKDAVPLHEAMEGFLESMAPIGQGRDAIKPIHVGRNPQFDQAHLQAAFNRFGWKYPQLATRNLIDVGAMCFPLAILGKVKTVAQAPLTKYFGLGTQEHTALADVLDSIDIYQRMLASFQENKEVPEYIQGLRQLIKEAKEETEKE